MGIVNLLFLDSHYAQVDQRATSLHPDPIYRVQAGPDDLSNESILPLLPDIIIHTESRVGFVFRVRPLKSRPLEHTI